MHAQRGNVQLYTWPAKKFDEAAPHEPGAMAIEIAVYGRWVLPTDDWLSAL